MTIISHEQERVTPVVPADWVPGPRQGGWTSEMYAALPDDGQRYEVVQGVLLMSPAPETAHQGIIAQIHHHLYERFFAPRLGLVFMAPIDVVLSSRTTIQPDILVVLKEHVNRVQTKRIVGVPDLVVEVISPSSATYDRLVKYSVYEQVGVSEYWLVNASEQTIEVFALGDGLYQSLGLFQGEQLIQSRLVPGEAVPAAQLFDWAGGLL